MLILCLVRHDVFWSFSFLVQFQCHTLKFSGLISKSDSRNSVPRWCISFLLQTHAIPSSLVTHIQMTLLFNQALSLAATCFKSGLSLVSQPQLVRSIFACTLGKTSLSPARLVGRISATLCTGHEVAGKHSEVLVDSESDSYFKSLDHQL